MKLAFLSLLVGAMATLQVPVVSNYMDFISGVENSQPIAFRVESNVFHYGIELHSEIYHEILPLNETHVFLMNEVYETLPNGRVDHTFEPKGESYICLCKKEDLVSILQRWKDGQYNVNDYAKFDCKYRSFLEKSEMFQGDSFWNEANLIERLNDKQKEVESTTLSDEVNLVVFKNRGSNTKKIVKVSYDIPYEDVIKEVTAESFLSSVTDQNGMELYDGLGIQGWKSQFPLWKDYKQLNSGFWGEPKLKNTIIGGRYSKSFVIASPGAASYVVNGQTTFLVKTNETQSTTIDKIALKRNDQFIKGERYLDYGEYINFEVVGLADNNQKVTVSIHAEIPVQSVVAYNSVTGQEIGQSDEYPFELELPIASSEINLEVVYTKLKKVKVDYSASK